jgi:hypothetical protein
MADESTPPADGTKNALTESEARADNAEKALTEVRADNLEKALVEVRTENAEKVLTEVRTQTAMPLLEIAAATGVRGVDLKEAVEKLEADNLVTVQQPEDPTLAIVSVTGKKL